MKKLTKNEIKQILPLLEELEHLDYDEQYTVVSDLDDYDETYIRFNVSFYTKYNERVRVKRYNVLRNDISIDRVEEG